jgi:hypothetical protein
MTTYQQDMISKYPTLLGPGDHVQIDYTTPTKLVSWVEVKQIDPDRKMQSDYGRWVAQLLQAQLGVDFMSLYAEDPKSQPITLNDEAIALLNGYFEKKQAPDSP